MDNLFSQIPEDLSQEVFTEILSAEKVRIERIVSLGHTSPKEGWYDQDENEWVLVLAGSGTLEFMDGRRVVLETGDYLNILARERHRVVRTDPDRPTVWLAVFYQ